MPGKFERNASDTMKILLQDLPAVHPMLRAYPIDLTKFGGLALERSGHSSPVETKLIHDDVAGSASIEWPIQDETHLIAVDTNRVTEEGAEAVALSYVHSHSGHVVSRRLQRGESADWLLHGATGWLALEVSGTTSGNAEERLQQKRQQAARCSLPAERLAVVVRFVEPRLVAAHP